MTCGCKVRTAVVGLAALMAVCFLPELLSAYEYRVPILVDDEDDIYEMLLAEDISDDEKDTLLELYRNPMDINKASRRALYDLPGLTYALVDAILEYRKDSPFTRASQLKKVAGITDDIYVQLKPFVRIVASRQKRPGKRKPSKIQGQVRAKVADRIKGEGRNTTSEPDDKYPESYLRVKVTDNSRWEVGALVSTENTIGSVSSIGHHMDQWVPVVDDSGLPKDFDDDKYFYLKTSGETYLPAWPKAYAAFEFGDLEVLVGSYRMGFGQRLTFDSLGRQNPYGFSPDLFVNESEYSFTPSKGQFGAVATIPIVKRGGIRLEATPFFSWWRYDAYQYIVRHREKGFCFNNDNHERGIDDPHCYESYAILQPYQDTDSYLQLTSQTLPRAYSELMGGANVTLFFNDRSHLGITGYTSFMDFHLGDEQTVFFGNTEIPERDLFGAVGLDGAFGTGGLALFAEAAVLDNLAYAGLVRGLFEIGDFIIEGSVRYYDEDYNNPHSRGYAMGDQFEGSRRAGEMGGMLSLKYRPAKWLTLRLDNDVWSTPVWKDSDLEDKRLHPWRHEVYFRVDTVPVDKLRFGAFFLLVNRDLSASGDTEEYYSSGDEPPRGSKYQWGVQASTRLIPATGFSAYYKQSLSDSGDAGIRDMEHYGVGKINFKPLELISKKLAPYLTVDVRGKYFEGNLEGGFTGDKDSAERYIDGYAQLGTTILKKYHIGLRGAMREHLEKENQYGVKTKKATEWFYKATLDIKF